jgi:osmotically-inducible protein OsmY
MIRGLIRAVLVVIVVVAIAAFLIGYRWANDDVVMEREPVVGTTGGAVDVNDAREVGAKVGETVAEGTNEARRLAEDGAITARIKSKMALDEIVEAIDIDVDTRAGVVTLSGAVTSAAERERALQLARETSGVTSVVDRLALR